MYALQCTWDSVHYHQNRFSPNCDLFKHAKKKSLGVRLLKFEIALVTYSPRTPQPSYPPWIVTLLIQAGPETPEEISYIFSSSFIKSSLS